MRALAQTRCLRHRQFRLPLDEEVQPLNRATDETSFALSDLGAQVGDLRLVWQDRSYDHARLHAA